jgi:peptide/nickel transport system substrate-binding protein
LRTKVVLGLAAALAVAAIALGIARLSGGSRAAPEPPAPARPRYRESPVLRDRVERGELPPVEQRLPDEPLVVPPIEGIGRYDSDPPRRP